MHTHRVFLENPDRCTYFLRSHWVDDFCFQNPSHLWVCVSGTFCLLDTKCTRTMAYRAHRKANIHPTPSRSLEFKFQCSPGVPSAPSQLCHSSGLLWVQSQMPRGYQGQWQSQLSQLGWGRGQPWAAPQPRRVVDTWGHGSSIIRAFRKIQKYVLVKSLNF